MTKNVLSKEVVETLLTHTSESKDTDDVARKHVVRRPENFLIHRTVAVKRGDENKLLIIDCQTKNRLQVYLIDKDTCISRKK